MGKFLRVKVLFVSIFISHEHPSTCWLEADDFPGEPAPFSELLPYLAAHKLSVSLAQVVWGGSWAALRVEVEADGVLEGVEPQDRGCV